MRVTLVHPAGFNFVPGQPDFSVLANRMPPIGIMQLASWLEKFSHSVQLHDCLGPYAPPSIAENAEIVLAGDPGEGALVGNVRAVPAKPGRGQLVTRAGTEVIQVSWSPSAHDSTG